jgi:hypothetical protein
VSTLFGGLSDSTEKTYPNVSQMLYIALNDGTLNSTPFCKKIYYNYEKWVGDETVFSIGGLNHLSTKIKIKGSQQEITLRTLLKSIPASPGMSQAQLFQHAKPNARGVVTMVVYNRTDYNLVIKQQATLEKELRTIIQPG